MTPETFKSIIHTVIKARKVELTNSEESKLSALAREFSARKATIPQVLERLKPIFADHFEIDRHDYDEIEKRLERS